MQRIITSWLVFFIPLSILFTTNLSVANNVYDFCEVKVIEKCIEPAETRIIDGFPHYEECWKYEAVYDCYEPEVTTCSPENAALETDAVISVTGYSSNHRPINWREKKKTSNNCEDGVDARFGCSEWVDTVSGGNIGQKTTCYNGPKLSCAPEECQILTQTCTHFTNGICDQETIKYSCAQQNVCGSDLGPSIVEDTSSNFGVAVAENAMLDIIASNGIVDPVSGEIKLFQGQSESCTYISQEWAKAAGVTGTVATIAAYYFGGALGMLSAPISAYVGAILNDDLNCCHKNPDKVDPLKSFGVCSDEDKNLSIANKTNRTVPLGGKMKHTCFCSDPTGLGIYLPLEDATVDGDCSQLCNNPYLTAASGGVINPFGQQEPQSWKKYYCVFDDILSKIIQTQGREQIRSILNGPMVADRLEVNKTVSYFGNSEWGEPVSSNGNIISFWQWDSSCDNENNLNSDGISENLGLFNDTVCPVDKEVYVAICSKNNSDDCGYYPDSPLEFNDSWDVKKIDLIGPAIWEEINPYAAIAGQCFEDKSCDWKIRTWPSSTGSKFIQKTNLVWQLKFPYKTNDPTQKYSWDIFKGGAGTLEFEMLTTIDQEEPEVEPRVRVRTTGASLWEEFTLPNPTPGPDFSVTTLSGIEIFFSGNCGSLFCNYNISRKVQLSLRPWYSDNDGGYERYCLFKVLGQCVEKTTKYRRDTRTGYCDGFTLDEFSILDIKSMDLSEYTDTLTDRAADSVLQLIEERP